jgi:multiubiquitin
MSTVQTQTIHVFVEVTKTDQRKIDFDTEDVTGLDIKRKAGVPESDDLARRDGGKLVYIANSDPVTLKNGEHFAVFPAGTIS